MHAAGKGLRICPLLAWIVALAASTILGQARTANACATCTVGDPTLVVMGLEQPYASRLRVGAELRHRSDEVGTPGVDRIRLREQRLLPSVAYAPTDWLMLSARLPLLHRVTDYANLARDEQWTLGDAELMARAVIHRDSRFAPRHVLTVLAGLELPTGQQRQDPSGQSLPLEVQPGSGSWDPAFGASYSFFSYPWSYYSSLLLLFPTEGYADSRAGMTMLTTHVLQVQPWPILGFRFGFETRQSQANRQNGQDEPDSGGFIGFVHAGLISSPLVDLVLLASVSVPVINALDGEHEEGPVIGISAVYDFSGV